MARQLHKLNALQVARLAKDGRHSDGGGLYLAINGERRRWVFLYRERGSGKHREMGLGAAADVSLAQARAKATAARQLLADGKDPLTEAEASRIVKTMPTFGEMADQFVAAMEHQWRNDKHRAQWRATLADHAAALRGKPVDQIDVADVLAVLKPIWLEIPETAGRLRGRIERVLNAAKAQGFRSGENPAAWRGHLENLLPGRPKLSRGHHAAMPWPQMPAFLARLRQREGIAAVALEFSILTAARSGEVRGATWGELDIEAGVWTIPAGRMKAGRVHRVPLVPRSAEIAREMSRLAVLAGEKRPDGLVFPGARRGSPLSDMSLSAVLRRMKLGSVTVHGFRSTFKDWASEATSFPNELSEAALAHVTGDATERAYRRGDALERRREMMAAWERFLEGKAAGNVVPLVRDGQGAA